MGNRMRTWKLWSLAGAPLFYQNQQIFRASRDQKSTNFNLFALHFLGKAGPKDLKILSIVVIKNNPMKLEALSCKQGKQLELARCSQAMPPQLRLMLNQFSLLSVKEACDNHCIPGAGSRQQ